jgi:hypothetical protein
MPLLSESAVVLPIHRKILAFSFIGWIFDFYDLLLLSFVISTTTLRQDLALSQQDVGVLLGRRWRLPPSAASSAARWAIATAASRC